MAPVGDGVLSLRDSRTVWMKSLLVAFCITNLWREQADAFEVNATDLMHNFTDRNTVIYGIADKLCFNRCPYHSDMPQRCPTGYYESNFRAGCFFCAPRCPSCHDPHRDDWLVCALQQLTNVYCEAASHAHRWFRARECKRCHGNCKECSGPGPNDCTKCHKDYWPVQGRCAPVQYTFGFAKPHPCYRLKGGCQVLFKNHSHIIQPVEAPPCPGNMITVKYSPWSCTKCWQGHCHQCRDWAECAFRESATDYYCSNTQVMPLSVRMCTDPSTACDSSPCANGANCTNELSWRGYRCDCDYPFNGPHCRDIKAIIPDKPGIIPGLPPAGESTTPRARSTNVTTSPKTLSGANATAASETVTAVPRTSAPETLSGTAATAASETVTAVPGTSVNVGVQRKSSGGMSDGAKTALVVCLSAAFVIGLIIIMVLVVHYRRSHGKLSSKPVDMKQIVDEEEAVPSSD